MKVHIPVAPTYAALFVGSCVYVVANATGDVTGFVVSKSLTGLNTAISTATGLVVSPEAGLLTYKVLDAATQTYFIPALQTSTKGAAATVAASAALITGVSVLVLWEGGKWIAKKLITQNQEPMENDFVSWDLRSDDYIIINKALQIEEIADEPAPQNL